MDRTITTLQAAREAAGYSRAYVADVTRRHVASVERWERGMTQPCRSTLVTLAELYQVPVEQLEQQANN